MKAVILLPTLSFLLLFFSCKNPEVVNDDKPRIKSVSIAGIPQKNIEFIADRYVINIQLPETDPEGGLRPSFGLTENTEFIAGLNPDGTLPFVCVNQGYVLKVANDKMTAIYRNTTSYQINFKPAPGCPEVIENSPITYYRDSTSGASFYIQVPLKNPFSSFKVYSIRLKNLSGGADNDSTLPSYLRQYAYNSCLSGLDNRVRLTYVPSPSPAPKPGTYEVSVVMTCEGGDRTLIFPQPLVIKE